MDLQRPEAAAEIDLLTRRELLVAKDHHVMVEVRLMNAREVGVINGQAQIQPGDFRAESREGRNGKRLCGNRRGVKRCGHLFFLYRRR
jgi:Mg-chelatase subunit ChlD